MMYKTLALALVSACLATGCVTMEAEPLPESFKGTAKLIDVPNSTTLKAGPVEVDEYFAQMEIKLGRSARLENDVYLRSSLISKGANMAKAGDTFLALPFSGPGYSDTSQFSWCKAGEANVNAFENFFTGTATPICLFWSNGIPRMAVGGSGSRIYPSGGTYDANVWTNVPSLTELGESDIGPLILEVKIDSVSSKGKMKVETMFRDPEGDRSVLITRRYVQKDDGSYEINVFNGRLRARLVSGEDKDKLYSLEVIKSVIPPAQ